MCKIEIIWPYVSYEAKSRSHYSLKPFVCGQGNAGWSTRLLCDQNWPITNASKGPPLAALAKWSQNQRSHYFETLLPRFGNTQPMEQTHRERRRDYASQNWRRLFITFARENGEQGAPKAGLGVVTGGQKLQALLPARSREEPLATLPRYISVSFGEEQPLLQREVPLLQFWESLSGQNMFSGAVICILGAKKIVVEAEAEVSRTV